MKKLLFVFTLLTIITLSSARHSDLFPLGTYSFLSEKPWETNNLAVLSSSMRQLGYNSTIMETFNPNADLTTIYQILSDDGIDVIISDKTWKNSAGNEKYATVGLTTGSYYRFEAECKDGSSSINGSLDTESEFWYGTNPTGGNTTDRIGVQHSDNSSSGGYVWRCTPNSDPNVISSGWAYTDLYWRWLTRRNATNRIGQEFKIVKYSPDHPEQDSLYIKFRLEFKNVPHVDDNYPDNTTILSFSPVGFKALFDGTGYITGHESDPTPLVHTLVFPNGSSKTGTVTMLSRGEWLGYRDLPSQSDDFELRISYQELIDKGLLRNNPNSSSLYILDNINPRLRYHGHYTLDLDYIEIEDKMHRVLEENIDEYNTGVNARIAEIMPAAYEDLVMGIYTLDEPMQPQFDAFKTVQGMVNLPGVKPMTAIHDYQYNKFRMGCVEDIFYDHIDLFCNSTNPDVIMPDLYPIKPNSPGYMVPEVLDWNNPDHTNTCNENVFIQTVLSRKVTDKYRATKNYIKQNNPLNGRMYPIVQAWGSWRDERWVNFMMPPSETQKMLQYLPLCYGADGIFNYRLCGWLDHPSCDEYAALNADFVGSTPANPHYSGSSVPYIAACPITYDALHEANAKVLEYGPKISQMYWINSVTITESSMEPGGTNLSSIMISSIQDVDTDQTGPYGCYVECGMFTDAANNPYLMLVNRRANYFNSSATFPDPSIVPVDSYETSFPAFDSQVIAILPDSTAYAQYGTHVAFIDLYDDSLYHASNQSIPVEIQPGDGVLLQMCSSLPASVTSDAEIKNIAYLSGPITIDNGAEVTIHELTETTIFAHSTIRVKGNSILNLAGIVTIKDTVNIIVEEGSSINFNGAICIWGYGSGITIDASEITATNSIFLSNNQSQGWEGIHVSNNSTISLDDTEINGAASNTVYNSNVYLSDCIINVPANSIGLHIDNWTASYDVRISATVDGKGFFGKGLPAYGLAYGNQCNSTFIAKTCFKDLTVGLENLCNLAVRDTIINCGFMDNERGIRIASNQFSPYIYTCNFVDNEIGIDLDLGASPEISNCTFDNCEIGIKTEMSSASSGGIYDCIFTSSALHRSRFGIVSRGSNLRVADNKFYTNYGILNHSGSILNMGNTAKNLFHAKIANFKFRDTVTYNAYVQLYLGHNDFYHENQGLIPTHDFQFDSNWYVPVPPKSNALNVSYNWFEDSIVEIVCPPGGIPTKYVRYTELDPSPNVFLEVYERMALALASEKQGDYVVANDTYRAILDEDLDAESTIMLDALDAYYRTSALVGDAPSETQAYLIAKTNQYAADNPLLTKYAEDYTVKSYLNIKDYQAAIDMIQVRLTDPESEIDSLLAVMDLEIVLQLAAMDQSKRPITTKYTQYIYPNRKVYNARHAEHWDKLNQLYNTEEDLVPIPNSSVISSNYPNPFNPSTTISYSIPEDSRVKLTIFNIKGQKIKDLVSENMLRGHHKFVWDGRDDGNRKVSSGIYFVKLEAAGNSYTHKMMLMK